jgi:hypothetical protein
MRESDFTLCVLPYRKRVTKGWVPASIEKIKTFQHWGQRGHRVDLCDFWGLGFPQIYFGDGYITLP